MNLAKGYLAVFCVTVGFALAVAMRPGEDDVVSIRAPIVILDVIPHTKKIELGGTYDVTFVFDKVREDCRNGRVVRYMWDIEHGWHYKIEDTPAIQSPIGQGKFRAVIETEPMNMAQRRLMQAGPWRIDSEIIYECPTSAGQWVERRIPFSTPIFEVYDPAKEKAGP